METGSVTTIATDGKTIAADSRATNYGNITSNSANKLYWLPDGSIIGGAGSVPDILQAVEALGSEEDPATYAGPTEFRLLRLHPNGQVVEYGSSLFGMIVDVPAATGSGGDIALGAMLAGKSPKRAVEIAASRDIKTGGAVHSFKPTAS